MSDAILGSSRTTRLRLASRSWGLPKAATQQFAGSPRRVRSTSWDHLDATRGPAPLGLSLASRAGKNAKKRAVVAVARKLVVLMRRIWITQSAYVGKRQCI